MLEQTILIGGDERGGICRNLQTRNDSPGSRSCNSDGSQSTGAIMKTVNLKEKFALFSDYYKPRVIGEVNDCHVKAVKLKGEFLWHHHDNEDELFLVVKGTLRMKFRSHEAVIKEGEFVVVPRGVEHCPIADEEAHIILIEPKSTLNTGNITNERTVAQLERI